MFMSSGMIPNLSASEQEALWSNLIKVKEAETAMMSCSVLCQELDAKLSEAKLMLLEKTKALHALYADRQTYLNHASVKREIS